MTKRKRKKLEQELTELENSVDFYKGRIIMLENRDKAIQIIWNSDNPYEARSLLMEQLGVNERQSQAIVEMRLFQLTKMKLNELSDIYQYVLSRIEDIKKEL